MAERVVRWALERALDGVTLASADAAAAQLARRYADDLDEAQVLSVQADRWLSENGGALEPVAYEQLRALLARIEQTAVLGVLGPKLLAALMELGMTPRARSMVARPGGSDARPDNPLQRHRAQRAARLNAT